LGPNIGALAPRARPMAELGVGAGGVPPTALRGRGNTPGKFVKTYMLNPAFWWHLLWNFLPFENYG